MVIGDMLRRGARVFGRKVGLVEGEDEFTYDAANRRVNRLARALKDLGISKGEKVSFMGNTSHEFLEFYFAVAKLGAVAVPVNARFSGQETAHVLRSAEVSLLIYAENVEETVRQARPLVPDLRRFVRTGVAKAGVLGYEDLLAASSDEEPGETVRPDDVALIMFTSGATGFSKGVVATQRNIVANTNTMCLNLDLVPEDVTLLAMPLYHNGGLWPSMSMVYRGGTTILMPRFDVDAMFETIERKKVTFINLVPTVLLRMVTHPELSSYDLSSVRSIMYAGAPIPLEQLKHAMKVLGPQRFATGLGSTEANGSLTHLRNSEHALDGPMASKLGSVGKDAPGVEIAIVDDRGREVPPGTVGEIVGRGDNVSPGYWNLPQDSRETFKNGWLYTGDVGYKDEDGYIFILDRKKDIIITGGENVASREVEETLHQHPAVYEAAVVGVPDEELGEAVKAVVALKPGFERETCETELIDFCRSRLAAYKKPRSVDFVAELPKNSVGKIDKATLKTLYRAAASGRPARDPNGGERCPQ